MHIALGLLGAIITILILLNRLADAGIDLGGMNPFLWKRRRKWKTQYEGDPIYKLSKPLDVTALLMVGVAKSDGDMSAEDKATILGLFQSEFHLSEREASELMIASVYLLKDGEALHSSLKAVVAPSLPDFTDEQLLSAVSLVQKVSEIESSASGAKLELAKKVIAELMPETKAKGKWQ
jgi:hypothetical protein